MFLSIATTHQPATDLGFLLMKHPDRLHEVELSFGRGIVFYPEANENRCEAAFVLDVDPVGLVRGSGATDGLLDHYVNDRPYSASSFLAVALNRIFRTAVSGTSRERQELANTAIPLEISVKPLPARGAEQLVKALFEPLGWDVEVTTIEGLGMSSPYVDLNLKGTMTLSGALTHLYVLIPVLDDDKHYWVGEEEIKKLLDKAGTWLADHPECDLIVRRYLKRQRRLVHQALARLAPEEEDATDEATPETSRREEVLEASLKLHDLRQDTVARILVESGASVVVDLGCGEGKLLRRLLREKALKKLIGLDASARSLERGAAWLRLGEPGGASPERVTLLHGALTYRDTRWHSAQAGALVEVIEHLDPDRLQDFSEVVFSAGLQTVVITTPNAEYNALFEGMAAGAMRHPDHRFEWTREQFQSWGGGVAERHGYQVRYEGIGDVHPEFGPVTQMAVFTK
ncbi:3' terminal RNA ribose 2'-O-methyltransferase Hen1 (plasmid) [Phyllobacteriaceae bacterium JZ32]